ncbi:hypothetical protein ACHAWF_010542 [Thalassiosira exigua]
MTMPCGRGFTDENMSEIDEICRASENARGGETGKESATSAGDSIFDAAAHLHSLLQSKEKELKEREADFSRRVNNFESQNPTLGKDTDLIQLNVGGSTNIAVFRRTLTMFEDSLLAAKFSGRWDDSMEKDNDGNFFVDQDPEHFLALISYLRLRMNNHYRKIPAKHLPTPSYAFCSMLDYYNLMPGVYPQNWVGNQDVFTCEEISYGTMVLSSKQSDAVENGIELGVFVLHDFGLYKKSGLSEFTVVFEKGATGAVGWMECLDKGVDTTNTNPLAGTMSNCLYLNIKERKVYGSSFRGEYDDRQHSIYNHYHMPA